MLPSNHATLAAALTVAVVLTAPRLWTWVVPLGVLAAGSRVAVGVHYPHDVAAGVSVGVLVVLVVALGRAGPGARLVRAASGLPVVGALLAAPRPERQPAPRPERQPETGTRTTTCVPWPGALSTRS